MSEMRSLNKMGHKNGMLINQFMGKYIQSSEEENVESWVQKRTNP